MNWPVKLLGEVARWGSGGTPKRSEDKYFGPGVPWLSISDLNDGVVTEAKESLSPLGLEHSTAKVVPAGTLLIAMYGSIGKLGISGREVCTSQAIAFAEPDSTLVDTRYLFHFLLAERPALQRLGRGGTQMNIGQADLKSWPIPLPPLDEQRRVAAILDQADLLRANRRETIHRLDALQQSIFLDMFGDPVSNPRRLPMRTLGDWVPEDAPITYGILKPGPDVPDGVPYVRVVDIRDGQISQGGVRRTSVEIDAAYARSRLRSGDLVISIRGHVGRLAVVPEELDGANITQDSARIRIESAMRDYVLNALSTTALERWMAKRTKGAAVRGINLGDLRLAPIPLPTSGEIAAFAARAARMRSLRSSMLQDLDDAVDLCASLQSRAFRRTS